MAKLTLAAVTTSTETVDVTALGSADWFLYNATGGAFVKKNATNTLTIAQNGGGAPSAFSLGATEGAALSWSDGVSPVSGTSRGGVYMSGSATQGWTITAPAGTGVRTLDIFAGIYGGGMTVSASLSDGSAASVSDSTSVAWVSGGAPKEGRFTLSYAAASEGQTLTATVKLNGSNTLNMQGAALSTAAAAAAPNAPTIGTAVPGNGYVDVYFTPAATGSSATSYIATLSTGETNTGASSPIRVTAANGTARTAHVVASNGSGPSPASAESNSVTPNNVNNPPTFTGTIADIGGTAGNAITPVDAHGFFSDSDALTYSASPAGTAWPSGLAINSSTGVISGTVAASGTTTGIKVRTTDTASQSADSNAFNVVISSGPVQVLHTDAAIVFSPYTWDDRGTYKSANAPGAYAKLAFTSTSVTAKFDVSALSGAGIAAGSYPIVRMVIDGKYVTDVKLTSANGNAAVTGLSAGSHTLEMYFRAVDVSLSDRWATPVSALRFTGFTLDAGATYSVAAKRAKNMIFFGDSITEGFFVMGQANPDSNNATQTVAPFLALAVGCELGQIGYSASGYEQTGNGGVPVLNSVIPNYSAGRSRLVGGVLSPAPDYVCVMHGANGTTTSAGVQTVIDTLRTIAPSARIFMMVPAGGYARTAITAAVAAKSADTKLHLIDLGTEYMPGMSSDTGNGTGQYSNDSGLHPNLLGNAKAASGYGPKLQAAIDGAVQQVLNPRTFAVSLDTALNTPAANLTGLKIRCYNSDGSLAYSTDAGTCDASGNVSVVVQSTSSAGASCLMVVRDATHHYTNFVTVS